MTWLHLNMWAPCENGEPRFHYIKRKSSKLLKNGTTTTDNDDDCDRMNLSNLYWEVWKVELWRRNISRVQNCPDITISTISMIMIYIMMKCLSVCHIFVAYFAFPLCQAGQSWNTGIEIYNFCQMKETKQSNFSKTTKSKS